MYNGGEIIYVRNVIFNDNSADHSTINGGRPCIILSDWNDKITLLPLSSKEAISNKEYNICINKTDLEEIRKKSSIRYRSYARLLSIFQRDLRYHDIVARLKLDSYYRLLCEIDNKRLEMGLKCSEIYQEIYNDLEYQRNKCKSLIRK